MRNVCLEAIALALPSIWPSGVEEVETYCL